MKGNEKLLAVLNQLLADELTAISQYMVHAEMCENWGHGKTHKAIESQAVDEMHHAEWLIGRILFLDGTPIVSKLLSMKIGHTVPEMIANDLESEVSAVNDYNQAIALATEVGDRGTGDLLLKILKMEESHVDWAETQRGQIEQLGLQNYLVTQSVG
jgi:bacterioferritin